MTSASSLRIGTAGRSAHDWHEVHASLRETNERLWAMVAAYQGDPSAIDDDVIKTTPRGANIDIAITETYRVMNTCVYAESVPLRVDDEIWGAFKEQQGEFMSFYRTALRSVEVYREVLQAYSLIRSAAKPRPQPGELQKIRQDKHAYVEERERCIEAVSDFHDKLSAMLKILPS